MTTDHMSGTTQQTEPLDGAPWWSEALSDAEQLDHGAISGAGRGGRAIDALRTSAVATFVATTAAALFVVGVLVAAVAAIAGPQRPSSDARTGGAGTTVGVAAYHVAPCEPRGNDRPRSCPPADTEAWPRATAARVDTEAWPRETTLRGTESRQR
jgi:hypothetical protein